MDGREFVGGGGYQTEGSDRGYGGDGRGKGKGLLQLLASEAPACSAWRNPAQPPLTRTIGRRQQQLPEAMATNEDRKNFELWIHVRVFDYGTSLTSKYKSKIPVFKWLRFVPETEEGGEGSITIIKDGYIASDSYLECDTGGGTFNEYMYDIVSPTSKISPSKEIYRLNTRDYDKGWEKVDAVLPRELSYPVMKELNGMLYIFDSRYAKLLDTQVYNPVLNTVSALPLKCQEERLIYAGADYDRGPKRYLKRFIFYSSREYNLHFYYPDDNTWRLKTVPEEIGMVIEDLCYKTACSTHHGSLTWLCSDDIGYYLVSYNYDRRVMSDKVYLRRIIDGYRSAMSAARLYGSRMWSRFYRLSGDKCCLIWANELSMDKDAYMSCTYCRITNLYHRKKLTLNIADASTVTYKIFSHEECTSFWVKRVVPLYMHRATTAFRLPSGATELKPDKNAEETLLALK